MSGIEAPERSTEPCPLWWREEGIERFVAGVFEGGGAKGILYAPAIQAMVEEPDPCWFGAVAGASAGAITATLIAAGLPPERLEGETESALSCLQPPTPLNGLNRVRAGISYLDQDALRDWLSELLEAHLSETCGVSDGGSITFRALHELTEIELDVVAVDLNRQRLVVFNHELTPNCAVVDAVVASAAIPMAFEWMSLEVPGSPRGIIVDGGVMSNFPRFVFTDASFRGWAELPPMTLPVIGFLLDEGDEKDARDRGLYAGSRFEERFWRQARKHEPKFRARRDGPSAAGRVARAVGRALRIVFWPVWKLFIVWIPTLLRWNASEPTGIWPTPASRTTRDFIRWYDSVIAGIRPWGYLVGGFVAASVTLGFGAYFAAWRPLVGHIGDIGDGDVGVGGAFLGLVFWLLWSVVPVYAWLVLSVLFFGASAVHRTVQMTCYGLVRTFLRGPGAPLWVGHADDEHIVRLRVPASITTLAADLDSETRESAWDEARRATRAELAKIEFGRAAPA